MAEVLRLRLTRAPALGGVALSRKDAALLAVLALDGACARDTLAAMLWPEADAARGRASLRQRRFRLARAAGAPVLDGDEILHLAAGIVHGAGAADAWLADDPAALDGELLEGLAFGDCPEVDRWLAHARERWRVLRAQALARLASRLEAAQRLAEAIAVAQRLVEDEPLSDHAARRLMRLHHRRGDLGAALAAYQRLAERLAQELGELPDDETAALAASLRQGQAPAPRAVPPTLARPPRRAGRDGAWATLQRAAAEGRALVIEGAPGIGKSRLLGDFLAAGEGMLLPALPGDAGRPYALLVRLLGRLWAGPQPLQPGGDRWLPDWARRELAALLPALGPAVTRTEALRLQQAVALALQASGLVRVGIDDVQQADAATLELLPALQREGGPAWWLAGRSGELPPAVTAWLQASEAPLLLVLEPLDPPALAALLDDLALPGLEAGAWAERLHRHTGGVPLFVLETLRSLLEQPVDDLGALPPPAAVAQAVRQRAARLPETARQLARAAAVWQAPLALEDAAALVGVAPAEVATAFAALESAQWLGADSRLHDLVAAALVEALPAAERRWRHGQAGERLRACGAPPLAAARHFEAAGRDADAAPLLEAAALAARRAARPAEDALLHERAAAAWQRAGQPARAFDALQESVSPRLFSGGSRVALATAEALMAAATTGRQRLVALMERAHALHNDGRYREAEVPAREAWALAADPEVPDSLRLRAACVLGNTIAYLGGVDEALAALLPLRPVAEAQPRAAYLLWLGALAQAYHRGSRLAECAATLRESVAQLEADEDWREVTTVAGNEALVLGNLGRYADAEVAITRARAACARLGPVSGNLVAGLALKQGHVHLGFGRLGSALQSYRQAHAEFQRVTAAASWVVSSSHALASAQLMRGDAEAAAAALVPITVPQPGFTQARRHLLLAAIAALRGQDPGPELARADAVLADGHDTAARLMVRSEALALGPGPGDPARLQALATELHNIGQGAQAQRVSWWQVDALRRRGAAAEAAALARRLLDGPLWPAWLAPYRWLGSAAAALAAAGDPGAAALAERAEAARRATLDDLAPLGLVGPPPW